MAAPNQDLIFLKKLLELRKLDKTLANKCLDKFINHLWYLSEELICLALFDKEVSIATKNKMLKAFKKPGKKKRTFRAQLKIQQIKNIQLEDFITKSSYQFFKILGINDSFLKKEASLWHNDEDYQFGRKICKKLKVVNDVAERGVALVQEFNSLITVNLEEQQFLLQVVAQNRKEIPNFKKSTLVNQLK